MEISIRGIQDSGKTAIMTGMILRQLARGLKWSKGYRPSDVHANYKINIDGVHLYSNDGIVNYLYESFRKGVRHDIIAITEADRVFPSRFWQDKKQTEALIGSWQDFKLFRILYWDAHIGTGVDVILRDTRAKAIVPNYIKSDDAIYYGVADRLTMRVYTGMAFRNVSKTIFPYYDRWEIIK
jgi:hypothetical protein